VVQSGKKGCAPRKRAKESRGLKEKGRCIRDPATTNHGTCHPKKKEMLLVVGGGGKATKGGGPLGKKSGNLWGKADRGREGVGHGGITDTRKVRSAVLPFS